MYRVIQAVITLESWFQCKWWNSTTGENNWMAAVTHKEIQVLDVCILFISVNNKRIMTNTKLCLSVNIYFKNMAIPVNASYAIKRHTNCCYSRDINK